MFANDVGAASWEEVNDVQAGKNYGWPGAEGISGNPAYTNPIHTFSHNGGAAAVTGAVFYEANQFPTNYYGSYFFANFISGEIFRMDTQNGNQVTTFATGASTTVDFDVAADGTMHYVNFGEGTIHRIRYVGDGNRSPTAVAEADQTYGPVPLTVEFTAAASSDPDGDALTYTWNFGDGSPTATGMNVSHTYTSNGIYYARVTVNDGHGGLAVSAPVKIAPGESPPEANILTPSVSLLYAGGDENLLRRFRHRCRGWDAARQRILLDHCLARRRAHASLPGANQWREIRQLHDPARGRDGDRSLVSRDADCQRFSRPDLEHLRRHPSPTHRLYA